VTAPQRIYLDNAATSWPKPPAVYDAVDRYQRQLGAPAGRGTYREASEVERLIAAARRTIAELVGASDSKRIIFTLNCTDSLNLALHGCLRPGDHVVTTVVEHNSVLRPLRWLQEHRQVEVTRVDCDGEGIVSPDDLGAAVRPNTRMIALIHASNVTGALQPIEAASEIAKQHGALLLVDAAQSLGHVPIDVSKTPIDLLAAAGHKGLLGPLGTGVLYIAPGVEQQLEPTRQGGTGTVSDQDRQPEGLPEKYESGNLNAAGLVGLAAGSAYIAERGVADLREHEMQLTSRLLDGLGRIDGLTVYGPRQIDRRVGVVSVSIPGYDPREAAALLDATWSIQLRAGIHCAPLMHRALGTVDRGGTLRFSPGPFSTAEEIDAAIEALAEMAGS
jgi:cysteine desulfurase/selenocysteine lyase